MGWGHIYQSYQLYNSDWWDYFWPRSKGWPSTKAPSGRSIKSQMRHLCTILSILPDRHERELVWCKIKGNTRVRYFSLVLLFGNLRLSTRHGKIKLGRNRRENYFCRPTNSPKKTHPASKVANVFAISLQWNFHSIASLRDSVLTLPAKPCHFRRDRHPICLSQRGYFNEIGCAPLNICDCRSKNFWACQSP